jgi:hypothetical protein
MRKPRSTKQASRPTSFKNRNKAAKVGKIHPIIIYPFRQSKNYSDLKSLYGLVERLDADRGRYHRPVTVMDRKTFYSNAQNQAFLQFRSHTVQRVTDLVDTWCVDTCQMWYSGLGPAFEKGGPNDVYWLIPGDFNYGTAVGQEVLSRLHDLPEIILELEQDLCIGEIATDHSNSKQLIDTYGTFALLYNWFPAEAQEIRQYTERPRSEFFAVRHSFLGEMLTQRWYPYEQTVVMLLRAVFRQSRISQFFVGQISDLPEGRETFASAMQQVERTERVLKSMWQERNANTPDWKARYRELETQSERVRLAALTILENLLD